MKSYQLILRKKISDEDWQKYSLQKEPVDDSKIAPTPDHWSIPRFPWDYPNHIEETHICSVFGCGKRLSRPESLFGDRCINHSIPTEEKYFKKS